MLSNQPISVMSSPVSDSSTNLFRTQVKAMILAAVDKREPADGLGDDEPLFGEGSRLDLDSLDGLQISMAIQKQYGIRMADSKDLRRALASLMTLSSYIEANKK
ncbi:MAG: phosphopantetheine-binding protein [Polaromonas sp.]